MALLVTVEEALSSMGMNENLTDELTPVISSAISKAQIRIESDLGVGLDKSTPTELFYTDIDLFNGITPGGFIALKLNRLFVNKDADFAITYQDGLKSTPVALPSTDYNIDYKAGVVKILADYANMYVTVVYEAGFSNPDSCIVEVKQAILALVPAMFRSTQVTTEASEAPKDDSSEKVAYDMIRKFMRSQGFQFRAVAIAEE
jgi:hypothetical protein